MFTSEDLIGLNPEGQMLSETKDNFKPRDPSSILKPPTNLSELCFFQLH
jgi:hypothetical protein